MELKIRNWLFNFLLLIVALPMMEHAFPFIESGKLKGIFTDAHDTSFTLQGWWSSTYQPAKEKYLNDHTGFRPDLVRLNCQLDFSLFGKCHAGWDILGKNGHMFQYPYINAYYGLDYSGYQPILVRALKLKALQDTFSHMGKSLVLVYAASKASSYPEYFPVDRVRPERGTTNHDTYRHICDSLGINQVDMDEWFVSMKNKSKEPLFSKQGIHWTVYGAVLAADSLMRYIECLRHIKLLHPRWDKVEHTDKLRGGDDDLAAELNLFHPYMKETLAYPIIEDVLQDSTQRKLNGIYLGDSYCQKMFHAGIIPRMSGQCEYWSYFNAAHDVNANKWAMMSDYDWKGAIRRADCLVLVYTTFNLYQLGNGFIEQAFDFYYPSMTK